MITIQIMRKASIRFRIYIPALIYLLFSCTAKERQYTQYVDPFIGTGGSGWSEGRCIPGPMLPYGMVQLSPEVRDDTHTGFYHYNRPTIKGFSHTHISGSGVADAADITFAPMTGKPEFTPGDEKMPENGYRSRFSKETEKASPGYYTVMLDDYDIKAELTATMRTGMHRYTFPESSESHIIVDLKHGTKGNWVIDSWIKVIDTKTIGGFRRSNALTANKYVYFVAEFSKPFDAIGLVSDGEICREKKEVQGHDIQAVIRYETSGDEQIVAKVGISAVSMESAAENLKKENPGWSFDKVRENAVECWEKHLAKIKIEDSDEELRKTFYTALYHTMAGPMEYTDVAGNYRGPDRNIHHTNGEYVHHTLFSLWDTYRTLHPLMTILAPERVNDIVCTFINYYEQSGRLPFWECYSSETWYMIGYHAVSVIADAYRKGIRDYDAHKALEACCAMAERNDLGLEYYTKLGYIPHNRTRWAVSKNLEYAYDDYCIAMLAKELGDEKVYDTYIKRSQFYKNTFNPENKFFMGKGSDGKWKPDFNPGGWSSNYCEAGAYQYRYYVPHDLQTLIEMFGGKEEFVNSLDSLFVLNRYEHDNEPSHHMPFLYNYAGYAWKTQEKVRDILLNSYNNTPEGLCGNDDVGQMSAWYVMSALGLYPVCPGVPEYVLTAPLFEHATIEVGNNKKFVISTVNHSKENKYIRGVTLNGKPYTKSYITHADTMSGGEICYELSAQPNKEWASSPEDCPYSGIEEKVVTTPYVVVEDDKAIGTKKVSLETATENAVICYTTDGSTPTERSAVFVGPVSLDSTTIVKALAVADGYMPSYISETTVKVRHSEYPKIIDNIPVPTYFELTADGGSENLIDGLYGTTELYGGYWVFFYGQNQLDVTIDLGEQRPVKSISTNFHLQANGNYNSFGPKHLEYLVSGNGTDFTSVYEDSYRHTPVTDTEATIKTFKKELTNIRGRYVRVKAESVGMPPPWSLYWYPVNMCIDEITIE